MIITGGAVGVDTLVYETAIGLGHAVLVIPPDKIKYGKRSFAIRNNRIAKMCDRMVAFYDGKSKGTKMTMEFAKQEGKTVTVKGI